MKVDQRSQTSIDIWLPASVRAGCQSIGCRSTLFLLTRPWLHGSQILPRELGLSRYTTVLASSSASSRPPCNFWLGGMFIPEAFITATRQHTAQENKWSLEELELYLEIGESTVETVQDTIVEGVLLVGAIWVPASSDAGGSLTLSEDLRSALPLSRLRWRLRNDRPTGEFISFPLYLNESRSHLLVEALVKAPLSLIPSHVWAQRGVCFLMQARL